MKRNFTWCAGSFLLVSAICTPLDAGWGLTTSIIHDVRGRRIGRARLYETPAGLKITVDVNGLPTGTHGMGIHTLEKCEAPDFKSAGDHFNPWGKNHGYNNPNGWHAGDSPNLRVGSGGMGHVSWLTKEMSILTNDNTDLLINGGSSIVIYDQPDDGRTDPEGNAGGRIACGSITR